jgi:hypothetical protein
MKITSEQLLNDSEKYLLFNILFSLWGSLPGITKVTIFKTCLCSLHVDTKLVGGLQEYFDAWHERRHLREVGPRNHLRVQRQARLVVTRLDVLDQLVQCC